MQDKFEAENRVNDEGLPAGGDVVGVGLAISWQDGPLGRGEDRLEPNGAFVETVLAAVLQRIEFYETVGEGRFACQENKHAISHIETALHWLSERTRRRDEQGVEGTHAGS